MTDSTIKIQNSNNISNGEIVICANKLNILFGRNGTGKSTIARAIYLVSQGKPLTELAPYGISSEDVIPQIDGVPIGNISIFDDEYVRQYVYQPDTLIKDTFQILIRSQEYDEAKKNIDEALSKIKTTITGRQENRAQRGSGYRRGVYWRLSRCNGGHGRPLHDGEYGYRCGREDHQGH
jgi:ABC-type cobalamin/Fe3+-siderophores transport system ATPase subunit